MIFVGDVDVGGGVCGGNRRTTYNVNILVFGPKVEHLKNGVRITFFL